MKKLKKIASVCLTSALLVASLSIAASAVDRIGINDKYTSDFLYNKTFKASSGDYLIGYFEKATYNHTARAGTHYNAGSVDGTAYVDISYVDINGKIQHAPANSGEKRLAGEKLHGRYFQIPPSHQPQLNFMEKNF